MSSTRQNDPSFKACTHSTASVSVGVLCVFRFLTALILGAKERKKQRRVGRGKEGEEMLAWVCDRFLSLLSPPPFFRSRPNFRASKQRRTHKTPTEMLAMQLLIEAEVSPSSAVFTVFEK